MRIAGGEVFTVALPQRRQHEWATKKDGALGNHVIVRLESDSGASGWGEVPPIPTWGGADGARYGETPTTVRHLIADHLLPAIEGTDPTAIGVVHARLDAEVKGHPYAKAALDIACHDLVGRELGLPVSTLLGGAHRDSVEVVHSLGLMDIERCLDEAEQAFGEGVRTFKCKTGREPERDVELVAKMRQRLGPDVRLRVDANEGYRSVDEAVRVTRAQEAYDLYLCEQPVGGIEALSAVAARVDVPIMADESAWSARDILELHRTSAATSFSCYVTKPGGLHRARQQAELAALLGFSCDIGGSAEGGIANAANLHLAAATPIASLAAVIPVTSVAGTGPEVAGRYFLDDIVTASFAYERGRLHVPRGPGLGVEVDPDKLRAYAV